MSKDPFFDRESEKYENPIASREYIIKVLKESGSVVTLKSLLNKLDITDKTQKKALKFRLKAMERDGQVISMNKNRYALPDKVPLMSGYVGATRDGSCYVRETVSGNKYFIKPRQWRMIFPGDKILFRKSGALLRGEPEAVIQEVSEKNTKEIVCKLKEREGVIFAYPINTRVNREILIQNKNITLIADGIVSVKLLDYPTLDNPAVGKVVKNLGTEIDYRLAVEIAYRDYNIPYKWPKDVKEESYKIPDSVQQEDLKNRTDLRDLPLVTIDGETAKDFDDAVYCEDKGDEGFRLIVAIADVATYVKEGSALDREAQERGNSVYFPGTVVPMLPEKLSNGLCSLNPGVDRLCLVCDALISNEGITTEFKFYAAVMNSKARMTYNNVAKILYDNDRKLKKQYDYVLENLDNLNKLFNILHKARVTRGAIDFDTVETQIIFDKNKEIAEIKPVVRNNAHRIIEECMLVANVAAANFVTKNKIKVLFRNHEEPPKEKAANLRKFLAMHGLALRNKDEILPQDLNKVLEKIQDRPDKQIIETIVLRSMAQAGYEAENKGHFGLAYDAYTHFTSPIRRYPDLFLHRQIHNFLGTHHLNKREEIIHEEQLKRAHQLGEQCSMTERRADDATRDVTAWLKCKYMYDKLGNVYPGSITGVTNFGIFITLKDFYVEGLVHITTLGKQEYFEYDEVRFRLIGERSGKIYSIGDKVTVKVMRVDLDEKQIDFDLVK